MCSAGASPVTRRATPAWLPYVAALVATAAACLLGTALRPLMGDVVLYVAFFAAVASTVLYGGWGPGLVATAATYTAANVLFIPPRQRFALDTATLVYFIVNLSVV